MEALTLTSLLTSRAESDALTSSSDAAFSCTFCALISRPLAAVASRVDADATRTEPLAISRPSKKCTSLQPVYVLPSPVDEARRSAATLYSRSSCTTKPSREYVPCPTFDVHTVLNTKLPSTTSPICIVSVV